ncbi:unnamed protein product [Rhizophagus irregularis]|nr:unnamed protein product [Rhizophagus irregularis]
MEEFMLNDDVFEQIKDFDHEDLTEEQNITSDFLREIETHIMIPHEKPKNAIDNKDDDNSFGEYSESIEAIDFTKLDLDKSN